ncbi:MAG: ABC transporter permease [Clostridia bacterium]|nr:ABC transporter permease [Clostridia bacterium]
MKKSLTLRNLTGRPGRTAALTLLVFFLSLTLCGGGLTLASLNRGLTSLENRLGADVIVMPSRGALKVDPETLFLQGTIGPYYMPLKTVEKINSTPGIARSATQIYLSSMRASCCSMPIQVIGFDPAEDFTVQSWLKESKRDTLRTGDLLVGSKVNARPGESIKLYNVSCPVAGQLAPTGTGLDTAVYCTLDTVRTLMEAAADLGGYSTINGDPADTVSAVYIKAAEGTDPQDVADEINIHVRKVRAICTRSMITDVSDSLTGLRGTMTGLAGAILVLGWLLLLLAFMLVTGERRREFATLRVCGYSRKALAGLLLRESLVISLLGAALGIAAGFLLTGAFSTALESALGLPFLMPGMSTKAALAMGTLGICLVAGPLASAWAAGRVSRVDTGLILREG